MTMGVSKENVYIISTVVMAVVTAVGFVIAQLSATGAGVNLGLFKNLTGDISDYFPIEATPADWTFSIWAFIFFFEIVWVAYALSTFCRSNEEGRLYTVIPVFPPEFTLVYSLNQVLLVVWLFLFDRKLIGYSSLVLLFIVVSCAICLWVNYRRVEKYKSYMEKNLRFDLVANRLLVQNGLSMYTTWAFVASFLNGAIALTYGESTQVDGMLASTILYVVIIIATTIYFGLDVTFWEKYTRYTFTPYIVVIIASLGSLNFEFDSNAADICELIALILGCVFLIGKIFRTIIRARYSSIELNSQQPTESEFYLVDKVDK
ncbi:uncharacterized protein LOC117118088 [Anneissia japonica]|uniref:uncharacterized protein LOC117118088 n=1 Tax=Anneissia japonica TaxID=1529436 RepID=UPI0014259B66|nr:uncharacterized protein LOC117118088 [Anneissia japonica]